MAFGWIPDLMNASWNIDAFRRHGWSDGHAKALYGLLDSRYTHQHGGREFVHPNFVCSAPGHDILFRRNWYRTTTSLIGELQFTVPFLLLI